VFNVVNQATLVSFVEMDKTVTKEETVVHLHKTRGAKDHLSTDRVTIEDLHLEVKVVKMWREGSSTRFVEDGMHKVNVGPKDNVMVVAIVVETIPRMSVVNRIKSLTRLIRCPIHNNKRETT